MRTNVDLCWLQRVYSRGLLANLMLLTNLTLLTNPNLVLLTNIIMLTNLQERRMYSRVRQLVHSDVR